MDHTRYPKNRLNPLKLEGSGDNTEKKWMHQFLAKPKTITAGGLGEAVSPQGGQGDALVKTWVQSP